jgi:hypothetical protein
MAGQAPPDPQALAADPVADGAYLQHPYSGLGLPRSGHVTVERLDVSRLEKLQSDYKLSTNGTRCTGNDVMTALLVQKHYRTLLRQADYLRLKIPINVRSGRQRLNVAYVGNAYQSAQVYLSAEELERLTLNDIVSRVHDSVAKVYGDFCEGRERLAAPRALSPEASAAQPSDTLNVSDVVVTNAGDLSPIFVEMASLAPRSVFITSSDANAFVVQQVGREVQAYLHSEPREDRACAP